MASTTTKGVTVLRSIAAAREARAALVRADKTLGFVPTMGSLHAGHLMLAERATSENDASWASVFVNPSQFAPHEDFSKYPRNLERDVELLRSKGVSHVFAPEPAELYPGIRPNQTSLSVQRTVVQPVGVEADKAEGRARPGHFAGVATVVTKLFNIIQPTRAYFGQKDGLQCIVIRQTVRDLNIPVDVVVCPTMREPDGLAMSSRNVYLSPEQRRVAPMLYEALGKTKRKFDAGVRGYDELVNAARDHLATRPDMFKVEYVSLVDADSGVELDPASPVSAARVMCSAAIHFGNCRILDNVVCG